MGSKYIAMCIYNLTVYCNKYKKGTAGFVTVGISF